MKTNVRIGALLLAASLGGWVEARAQEAGPNPSTGGPGVWRRYTQRRGWVGYAPGSGAPPSGASAGVVGPAPVASAPATRPGGRGWQGYAPGTAFQGYSPGASWRRYKPTRSGEQFSFRAGERGIYADRVIAIAPSAYRELGTGRQVPLSKPWLPDSP